MLAFYKRIALFLAGSILLTGIQAAQPDSYRVDWHIAIDAGVDSALVTLVLEDDAPVTRVAFSYDPDIFSDFTAQGELEVSNNNVQWIPPEKNARLSYKSKINRERASQNQAISYDALITDTWALFRGDRITPRMNVTTRGSAQSKAVLQFHVPDRWGVNTGWPVDQGSDQKHVYLLNDPDRRFDRPAGWFMLGRLGVQRADLGTTLLSIVAPLNSAVDRMSWLTLVSLVWPELEQAFGEGPAKILLVSGDDPLWRGGLSGPNSFYFHSSRRAISENGSSPLFHELTHVVTRISGAEGDDWIAEGIAEYYGIELIHRAGGYTSQKKAEILADLADWGQTGALRGRNSTGRVTARAVLVFDALDLEIRKLTNDKKNLDAVTRRLIEKRRVSLEDLAAAYQEVTGQTSPLLASLE